ncbi:MAG: lipid-A-disaccharide synthase [Acidobacteriota bacterium]|nr:MAG: lipid-A-disaccharide synthase [Acidobacteriota bacterium]
MELFLLAGEASGDAHAASLLRAVRQMRPDVRAFGVAGDQCAAQGFEVLHHARDMGVVGLTEAVRKLPLYRRVLQEMADAVAARRPDGVVLVDFPDFNLRLGREIRVRAPDIPIVYFISPQVWAWRRGRVHDIAAFARRVLVIFPFEEEFYRDAGVEAVYVGHPLVDEARPTASREDFLESAGLDPGRPTVAVLPGSRESEVRRHIEGMLGAAARLAEERPEMQFVLSSAPTLERGFIPAHPAWRRAERLRIALSRDCVYNVLNAADAAMVTSGTATVEAALLGVPMVVVYGLSRLSYFVARRIVDVPWIAMANLLAGEAVVPELIQEKFRARPLAREVRAILEDSTRREVMLKGLEKVRKALGESGAARRAAEWVLRTVEEAAASEGRRL